MEGRKVMNNKQGITFVKKESKVVGDGYKIIEINISDQTESLYAVCTPIKKY